MGQTPPPYGGQALMTEHLVRARLDAIEVHHLRLGFSATMASVGRAEPRKVLHLAAVLVRAVGLRLRQRFDLVLFSPAGPNLVPVLRDVVLLGVLRVLFPRVVLHFHAAGVSEFLAARPAWLRRLALLAYGRPTGAIQTSALNPADGTFVRAHRVAVIPNGIPDEARPYLDRTRTGEGAVRILYVGKLDVTKGVLDLLESVRLLTNRNRSFSVWFMGQFGSADLESAARRFCVDHRLEAIVEFVGQRTGAQKWEYFHRADILCFPSYFESESFGNVVLEGMMFRLPVVATRWRGVPDLVEDGQTGLLVPVRDPSALADALDALITDGAERRRLGLNGRQRYLSRFTLDTHLQQMEAFLADVARS